MFTLLLLITCVLCQRDEDYPSKPDRCQPPVDFLYRQCCVFPPFFTREAARSCGALLEINFIQANVTALRRQTLRGCEHWRCILKKYDLLNLDGKLDDEKYFTHLNRWVDLNSAFVNVMSKAKMHCKLGHRHLMPLDPCEFYNLHACIRNYINTDCPQYIDTKECNEVKRFNDECRDFFIKK